ncbi:MAG: hypothetical protein ABI901_03845 [Roseiflexaceae bacterium]
MIPNAAVGTRKNRHITMPAGSLGASPVTAYPYAVSGRCSLALLDAAQTRNLHTGETNVAFIIIFTFGYLFGGVSALCILGLAVAARQGDRGHATPPPVEKRA